MKIEDLKVGAEVHYIRNYDKQQPYENGIIKAFWKFEDVLIVQVVYHCNDDWDNYRDYTAARSPIENLRLGWLDAAVV